LIHQRRDVNLQVASLLAYPIAPVFGGTAAAIVVGIVALVTIFFLVIYNRQTTDEVNANAQMASATASPQQPIIVQQPATAPQQPVIVQQPAQPAHSRLLYRLRRHCRRRPRIPATMHVLTALNKKFEEDAVLSGLALNADVLNGKVLLTGNSYIQRSEVESRTSCSHRKGCQVR